MSEEAGTPTESSNDMSQYVSMDDGGSIILSPEAEAILDGREPEESVQPESEVVAKEENQPPPPTQKIKWNGQEIDVPETEAVALLQKGYNYEQKMQQLEAERARLQAYSGLVNAIEVSPEIRQKVSDALGYTQQQAQPEFDDPIQQLKYETRQEVLREVEKLYIAPLREQANMTSHQNVLNSVRAQVQADPMYSDVQAEIVRTLKAMPESISKNLYLQLDQDPSSYMDMFNTVKQTLTKNQTTVPQTTNAPKPLTRETKAPLLESGNNDPPDASENQKHLDKIKDLTRRSKNGDFRATGELLEMMA